MKMHAGVARESFRYPSVARQKRSLDSVRTANLQWARKFGLIPSEQALVKIEAIQIEQMAAAVYPEASKQVLALCTDLLLWFFISDDQYDERALGADPMRMEQITNDFMQVLRRGVTISENPSPLSRALMDLRNRVHVQVPAAWYARFVADMELYFQGCLTESKDRASGYTPEFEEYRTIRRASVGTYPCFDLIELSLGIFLPDPLEDSPLLTLLRDVSTDIVAWVNDVVSYPKESAHSDPHNLVSVLITECGISLADSVKKTVELHNEQMLQFERLASEFLSNKPPVWAPRYIEALRSWMRGVFDWSFQSGRYSNDYVRLSMQDSDDLVGPG
jgi:Terpene synthase family 2, C-terminal metal binding